MARWPKRLFGSASQADAPPNIDTAMFGLHEAMLSGWFQIQTGELFRGMPITADDVVVDVGCGEGGNLSFCASRGAYVIGVDVDEEALRLAAERMADSDARGAEFHLVGGESVPVADNTATRVICTEVLEHVEDPSVVLAELLRIGAPGALYLITVPDALQERMQKHVASESYFQAPNHIRIIERDEFAELVSSSGLEVVKQDSYGFFWAVWWAMVWGTGVDPAMDTFWQLDFDEHKHPTLAHWTKAWSELLKTEDGRRIKEGLDAFLPKSQVIIARKPE